MRSRAFVRSLPPGFGRGLGRWALLLLLVASVAPGRAQAQQLSLQLDSDEVYAGLPFVLTVAARGFDESPQPTLSKLAIPGCKVTSLGVSPNVSSMVQIVNGQRSEFRNVTFAYRFRIETTQSGQYTVPPLTAEQGGKKATSPPARFSVKSVDDTKDMQLRLILPERPLWVGETVDATLEWYLRRDVGQRTFSVPLFDQDEWVEIEAPPGQPRLGGFQAGSRQLELPYSQDKANLDGSEFARFRFQFRLTPSKVGTLSLPPARIVAALNVGFGRDVFGFQVPESRLFAAATKPLKLEIRPLPQAGRPASFKNAVGSAFNIEVSAGRTVVRVGDPIELRILLRGNGERRRTSISRHIDFIKRRTDASNQLPGLVRFNECVRLVKWWRIFQEDQSHNLSSVPTMLIDLLCASAFDRRKVATTYGETLRQWFDILYQTVLHRERVAFTDFAATELHPIPGAQWMVLDPVNPKNNVAGGMLPPHIDELARWLLDARNNMQEAVDYDRKGNDQKSLYHLTQLFGSPFKQFCES